MADPEVRGVSRRDAIVGALALAAGTLIASKPDVALGIDGAALLGGRENSAAGTTVLAMTDTGAFSWTEAYTIAYLNYYNGTHDAVRGETKALASAGSSGVRGHATRADHIGVTARNAAGGVALNVDGKVTLSRSGRGTVTRSHSTSTVTVPSGVGTAALILVTLQGSGGSGVYLKYAKRASATTFRVYLNKACTTTVAFAWMIVG